MTNPEYPGDNPLVGLVDLSVQRLLSAEPVAAVKFTAGRVITDQRREREVIDAVADEARAWGIDPDYVRAVFRDQIDATVALEHRRMAEWKRNPAAAPTAVPELSASRAIIDSLNRTLVREIALRWASLHSPTCAIHLANAKSIVIDARRLDQPLRDALDAATQRYWS